MTSASAPFFEHFSLSHARRPVSAIGIWLVMNAPTDA